MVTSIQKWGNGTAIRLPEAILKELLLQENDQVVLTTANNSIIIRKSARAPRAIKSLAARFEGYTGNYQCSEWDTGKTIGTETW